MLSMGPTLETVTGGLRQNLPRGFAMKKVSFNVINGAGARNGHRRIEAKFADGVCNEEGKLHVVNGPSVRNGHRRIEAKFAKGVCNEESRI